MRKKELMMTLNELKIGKSAKVITVGGDGALRQHLLDMGLIPGAELTMVKLAPMGDPMEVQIHGYELTLRVDDAKNIENTFLSNMGNAAETVKEKAGELINKTFFSLHTYSISQ